MRFSPTSPPSSTDPTIDPAPYLAGGRGFRGVTIEHESRRAHFAAAKSETKRAIKLRATDPDGARAIMNVAWSIFYCDAMTSPQRRTWREHALWVQLEGRNRRESEAREILGADFPEVWEL